MARAGNHVAGYLQRGDGAHRPVATENTVTLADRRKLEGVHPELVTILEEVFDEMDAEPAQMFVVMGARTAVQQAKLYAQGRTEPGEIVTNCDGVKFKSPHQPREDGFVYAVDCAFIGGQPFDRRHPWEMYGSRLEERGAIWGGRFSHPVDLDHAELKPRKVTET